MWEKMMTTGQKLRHCLNNTVNRGKNLFIDMKNSLESIVQRNLLSHPRGLVSVSDPKTWI